MSAIEQQRQQRLTVTRSVAASTPGPPWTQHSGFQSSAFQHEWFRQGSGAVGFGLVFGLGLVILLFGAGCRSEPSLDLDEAEAIAAIQSLGGRVTTAIVDDVSTAVSVDLRHSRVTDAELVHLSKLPNVKTVRLARTEIGDNGLKHVGTMESLEELYLGRTRVTDQGLQHLAELEKLKWIAVNHTKVTDGGVRRLQKSLPALKRVR